MTNEDTIASILKQGLPWTTKNQTGSDMIVFGDVTNLTLILPRSNQQRQSAGRYHNPRARG
jgi:hypothetical protein